MLFLFFIAIVLVSVYFYASNKELAIYDYEMLDRPF